MNLVYVASPYTRFRQLSFYKQATALSALSKLGAEVWRHGAVAIIPARNSWAFESLYDNPERYYRGYLALLQRCDAMLCCFNNVESFGRDELETRVAIQAGIPIFTRFSNLKLWLASHPKGVTP